MGRAGAGHTAGPALVWRQVHCMAHMQLRRPCGQHPHTSTGSSAREALFIVSGTPGSARDARSSVGEGERTSGLRKGLGSHSAVQIQS